MTRQIVRSSIEINAPVELVWQVTGDPATFVEGIDWVFEAWKQDDSPVGLGSIYFERAKPGMKEGVYRWEITAFEPLRRIVHSHTSGELDIDLEVILEPLGPTRTRYTQVMHFRAMPAFRPLGFILERTVIKKKMQQDMDQMILPNYKRIAETQYHTSQPTAQRQLA